MIRQEAEKIVTYKGEDKSTITLGDINACLGATNAEISMFCSAYGVRRPKEMEETLHFLFLKGQAP